MLAAALIASGCGTVRLASNPSRHPGHASPTSVQVARSLPALARASATGRYGIVERKLAFGAQASPDLWEIPVTVALTSPSGRITQIGGFYYAPGTWEFRFSPPERGRWRWRATLSNGVRKLALTGTFKTQRTRLPGFVHATRFNGDLWSAENGAPYYPLGLETCLVDDQHIGTPFAFVLDGGFRPNGGAVAPGQKQDLHGAGGRSVGLQTYIRTYARAGFNLFRWSVDNCSFGLYDSISPAGNVYNAANGRLGDQLVRTLHQYGMRVYMTIFGFNPPDANGGTDPNQMAAIERYVKYVVDRYGAHVDFWELMNEATRSSAWYDQITSYLRSVDPYHHPISTSYPPADLSRFDINSPHWYERENEFVSDIDTFQRFAQWKAAGKPVIVGEQGNSIQNWDPRSGLRMRLRIWTAFFSQGALVLWNEVAFKDLTNSGAADIWLGPTERHYTSVLQRFTAGFDPRARIGRARVSRPNLVRGYVLNGPRALALYLTAYTDHSGTTRGVTVSINSAFRGTATWISPATGQILRRQTVRRGSQRLSVPAFNTDIAFKAVR